VPAACFRLAIGGFELNKRSETSRTFTKSPDLTGQGLHWRAARLSWPPERLRLVVWLLGIAGACFLLLVKESE
jgi:hypothetical protein